MATYLILNIIFIAVVVALLRLKFARPSRAWLATLAILIVLTAIFDTIIIHFDIVGYDEGKLLGIYIGAAPIEDFFYAILAVILIPTLWNKLGGNRAHK
jgi:lycopene cyclase domain-containing protein